MSENIEAVSIVDYFLEHTRSFIFCNNDDPEVFISSADFMTRNLDGRVEVACPIYDDTIKKQIIDTFNIGWKGNVKARYHSEKFENNYRVRAEGEPIFRAQHETYNYYKERLETLSESKRLFYETNEIPKQKVWFNSQWYHGGFHLKPKGFDKDFQYSINYNKNLSLEDIAGNFKEQAARILERDVNDIDMGSADFETAFNFGEEGKKRMMSSGEWEILLRSDAKYGWDKTQNAKEEARGLASSIAQAFGKII
jgi:hypothetical protein